MSESFLQVVPLRPELFDSWSNDLKDRWVQYRSESGKVTLEEAQAAVTRIIDKRLPEGIDTAGQFVLGVTGQGRSKGSFWLEIKGSRGFLYDVFIHESIEIEDLRNLVEKEAMSLGASELRVNVFSGDQLLRMLTASDAYVTINSQMWRLDNQESDARETKTGLVIRPMTEDEFPNYYQRQIDEDAAEKVAAGTCTPEEVMSESKEEIAKLLPDGLRSEDQYIFVAELQNVKIGTVWVDIDRESEVPRAFVLDIEVEQSLRGQGLGRDLMLATQLECRKLGAKGFALSVFGHNSIARNLYESFGFVVTEEMKKRVLTDRESIQA